MRIRILSGAGRHADAWHDFPATTARLAALLAGPGRQVEITDDVEHGLAELADPHTADLLVVNAGRPTDNRSDPATASAVEGLRTYVDRGGPVLAVHAAANAFGDEPRWREAIGGQWIPEVSMHPPYGLAQLSAQAPEHPVGTGIGDLELRDERYSYLATDPGIAVLYDHEHDDLRHPAVWAVETPTGRRAVYDGLGHSVESYDDEPHCQLLRQAAAWLLREDLPLAP